MINIYLSSLSFLVLLKQNFFDWIPLLEIGHQIYTYISSDYGRSILNQSQYYTQSDQIEIVQLYSKINSSMSKYSMHLREFVNTVHRNMVIFPKKEVNNYVDKNQVSGEEITNLFNDIYEQYQQQIECYRDLVVLLFLSLTKNVTNLIDRGLNFLEGLIRSRLILLIFKNKSQFCLDQILVFMEQTLDLLVLRCLQNNFELKLLALLTKVNRKDIKFNEINFLLEYILIKKIEKYLDQVSWHQFKSVIKDILGPIKIKYLENKANFLHFKEITMLRQQEDKYESYMLQFINNNRLLKVKDIQNNQTLPTWVQQSYFRMPRSLNLLPFKSQKVLQVFQFLSYAQIFASSPLIQEFDSIVNDNDQFLSLFQKFLLGQSTSQEEYRFSWQKVQQSLDSIRKRTLQQEQCYQNAIASEISTLFKNNSDS